MPKIVLLHTSMVSFDVFNSLFRELAPDAEIRNIVDEDLLATLNKNRCVTKSLIQRVCNYCILTEAAGADLIFSQCSSTRAAIELARKMVDIPIVMVDDGMSEKAVSLGTRIGIVATAAATLVPSSNALNEAAQRAGKDIEIRTYLADGALQILMEEKNEEKHNRIVLKKIDKAEAENDVVILAQGSMIGLTPFLGKYKKPVLTSPRLGVEMAIRVLNSRRCNIN
jgi:Asp/Glu/hydantoin racemase